MTSAPPEPKLQPKNPGVEKPEGFFVKNSCIVRKSDNPHFGALLVLPEVEWSSLSAAIRYWG